MSHLIIIPRRVLADTRFKSMTHLRVLMSLGNCTDDNGWAFVKRKTLAASVGVTRARISQCITDLREWGYIQVVAQERKGDGGQTCNRYRVLYDVGAPDDFDEVDKEDVSEPTPPVSDANPPVNHKELTPGLAPYDLPGGKSLAFTPVVNDVGVNDKSSSNAREAPPVDNSDAEKAAAANSQKSESQNHAASTDAADVRQRADDTERAMLELLTELEAARGSRWVDGGAKDRVHLLTWIGKGVTLDQLRAAHALAVAARERDTDARAVNAGFLAIFVNELLSPATPKSSGGATACAGNWYEGGEAAVCEHGAQLGVREKKRDELWQWYRVLVAAKSRDPRAIEFVLKDAQRFNDERLYQFARTTFGDALMPVDDYAS